MLGYALGERGPTRSRTAPMKNLPAIEAKVLKDIEDHDGLYEDSCSPKEQAVVARLTKGGLVKRYRCKAIETFGNPKGWAYRTTVTGRQVLAQLAGCRN